MLDPSWSKREYHGMSRSKIHLGDHVTFSILESCSMRVEIFELIEESTV